MDFPTTRRTPLFLALVLGLSLSATGCGEQETPEASGAKTENSATEDKSEVVATVNGEPITEAELAEYRSARPSSVQMGSREELLDELITREVVYQEALEKNLDEDPEVKKELEQLRTRVLVSAAVRKAMEENPVTDEQLQAEYKKFTEQMGSAEEYKASHILVKEEDKAKSLIKELEEGADFAKLARENSTGPTGKKGGDLGWFNPQQMVPEFSQALAKLKKGEFTKEPVKTQFGWHVIKLEDTRTSEPPPFEQLKPRLEQVAKQKQVGEYIQELKDTAEISIKEEPAAEKENSGSAKEESAEQSETDKDGAASDENAEAAAGDEEAGASEAK